MVQNPNLRHSMRTDNEFMFNCPIFRVDVKMAGCVKLRNKKWRGEYIPVRKGCQACMDSSKCPIVPLTQQMLHNPANDLYFSEDKKVGKLSDDLLERIERVIVLESHIERHHVPESEKLLILQANADTSNGVSTRAKGGSAAKKRTMKTQPTAEVKADLAKEPEPNNDVLNAAMSGDMSAALNKAIKKEGN